MPPRRTKQKGSEGILRPSDEAVLEYLKELNRRGGEETCTASIPEIAVACSISERQVQISTRRLIESGLLERVGYDLSNPDRSKRGTIYKVLLCGDRVKQPKEKAIKRSIKFLIFWSED